MALTLSPLAAIVKRGAGDPIVLAAAALVGFALAAVLAAALLGMELQARAAQRMDRFGAALADMAAQLALPNMLQQRRTELERLATRIVAFEEVAACGFYTADDRALATAGRDSDAADAARHRSTITVDNAIAGSVRIALDSGHFRIGTLALALALWPLWLGLVAAAGGLACVVARARRTSPGAAAASAAMSANEGDEREPALASGERRDDANAAAQTLGDAIAAAPSPSLLAPAHLAPSAPAIEAAPAAALPRADAVADAIDRGRAEPASTNEPALSVDNDQPRAAAEEEAPALDVAARPAAAPGAKGAFILVAKLFNRAALPQQAAAAALAAALKAAQQVAETWRGRAEAWSDAGVAMHFPADRVGGVEAARAARELAERLHALGGESQFRCGLHWCAAQTSRTQVADGVAEAGLLSALAPAGKLAVSEAAFVGIEPAQRASASDVPAAAVTALAAKALGRCRIVLPEAAAAEVPAAPTP